MAFIGNTNTTQAFTPAVDYFSGNASTTAFTLSRPVASVAQVQAVVNNVAQNPSSAFTVSGNTVTFTSAPSSGTNNIYVYYTSPITQVIAPSQGTVGTTQLQNGLTVNFADGTAVAPSITNDGDTNTGVFYPAADTVGVSTGGSERMRVDSSGNVGIGTSNTPSNKDTVTPKLIVNGAGLAGSMQVVRNTTVGAGGAILELTATRGSDVNSYTILQSGDGVGSVVFGGADGNEFVVAASINAQVDGTPGDNDMPGRLVFNTTADGASSPTERMRIDSSGNLLFNSGYGSVATAYGCRAWVNFNGTGTVAIRGSGNVSSITDNAAGIYTVNFTTAMTDTNYAVTLGARPASSGTNGRSLIAGTTYSTSAVQIQFINAADTAYLDPDVYCVAVFR